MRRLLTKLGHVAFSLAFIGLVSEAPVSAEEGTPTVRIVTPASGQRVQGEELTVEVEYVSEGSGIAPQSFRALLNGQDIAGSFDQHSRGASGRVRAVGGLPLGENTLTVEIANRAGKVTRAMTRFFNAGSDWLAVIAVVRGERRLGPLAVAPDGRMLAAGFWNGTVQMWALSDVDVQQRANLKANRDSVSALAFSLDGKLLASGGWDGAIHVWSITDVQPKERVVLTGHSSTVSSLAFVPDGTILVSGSRDGTIRTWSVAGGGPKESVVLTPQPRTNAVYAIAISPNGRTVASGNWEGTVGLWEVANARSRMIATLDGHLLKVFGLAFAPGGSILASGGLDKKIYVWDVTGTGARRRSVLEGHKAEIAALVFKDDKTLLSAARDGVRLWDVTSGRVLKEVGLPQSTRSIGIAAGGRYLAVGDGYSTIYVLRIGQPTGHARQTEG